MQKFTGPIFFTDSHEMPLGSVTANGSFGLVDTGSKKLLVTCYHVWEEFQKAALENPDSRMCICPDQKHPIIFSPAKPLGEDRNLDVVTFDIASLVEFFGADKFYPINQKPPPKVEKTDALFFIGYPGNLRCVLDEKLGVGRAPYAVACCSVDGLRFQSDISKIKTAPDKYGGISGCPCFLVRESKPIQLVGFATAVWTKYLFFTHARCLNLDGTIKTFSHKASV